MIGKNKMKIKQRKSTGFWLAYALEALAAIYLGAQASNKVFAKTAKPSQLETAVQAVSATEVNDISNLIYNIPDSNEPNKPYEPNKPSEPNCTSIKDANELEIKASEPNDTNALTIKYTPQEHKELQNILYAEAANQSSFGRKTIAKVIVNRTKDKNYPDNLHDVIFEGNAFSCIFDNKNKNWEQATGKLKRNEYEEGIYQECEEDANSVLNGEKLGIPRENEIIAYHDLSVKHEELVTKELELQKKYKKQGRRYDGYWMNLEPIAKIGRLIFYAPKSAVKS